MKDQQLLYALGILFVVSLIGNIYLLNTNKRGTVPSAATAVATSTSISVRSPYGYRSEVVTVLDNGELKTYATTSAIREKDLRQIESQARERMRIMDDYFNKQNVFFRHFWSEF